LLTEQWFSDAKFLAKKAIQVVKKKKTFIKKSLIQFSPNKSLNRYQEVVDNLL